MNTVVHLRSANGFYGAERVIVTMLSAMNDSNFDLRLMVLEDYLTQNTDFLETARQTAVQTDLIPCRKRIDFKSLRSIRLSIKKLENATVIHGHDVKSNVYGLMIARLEGLGAVTTLHGWTSDTGRMRFYERIDRTLLKLFDRVVAVSQELGEYVSAKLGLKNVAVIPNGVDTEMFSRQKRGFGKSHWCVPEERFVFGIFARLTTEKGHSLLLKAFAAVVKQTKNVHLMITGDGPELSSLQECCTHHGVNEHVSFVAAHGDVDRALHDIDCYVSPSHTEGMPMILLECMASGIPIVATDVGSIPTLLGGGSGTIVSSGDAAALTKAMVSVATGQFDRDAQIGRALKRSRTEYSAANQAEKYAKLYAAVAAERNK